MAARGTRAATGGAASVATGMTHDPCPAKWDSAPTLLTRADRHATAQVGHLEAVAARGRGAGARAGVAGAGVARVLHYPAAPPVVPPSGAPAPPVDQDPVVATGGGAAWRAWLRQLLTAARARLAGAAALLLGALAVGAAALALFGALADEVTEGETAAVDQGVAAAFRGTASPSLDELARLVSALGSEVVAVLLVALVGYFGWRRRWGAAASLVLVTVGAQLLNTVLKDHFRRPRPAPLTGLIPAQAWSFPSGHAMVAAAFYLFLAYVGWRLLRGPARVAWAGLLVVLVLLIDVSRLYLSAHYLTDVVAGNAVGLAWTAAVVGAGNLLALRRRPSPSAPDAPGGPGRASRRIPLPLHAPRAAERPTVSRSAYPHRGHRLCHPPGFPDQTLSVIRQIKTARAGVGAAASTPDCLRGRGFQSSRTHSRPRWSWVACSAAGALEGGAVGVTTTMMPPQAAVRDL